MLQSDGFNGEGGKGNYGWLQRDVVFESRFVAACTGMMYLCCKSRRIQNKNYG